MIGTTVRASKRWPAAAFLFTFIAGCFVLFAFSDPKESVVGWTGAALFASAAIFRWFAEPAPLELKLEEQSFMTYPNLDEYRYSEVVSVNPCRVASASDSPRHYEMVLKLKSNELFIPEKLNVPSRELEEFFASRITAVRNPPEGVLKDYIERLTNEFGKERIWWARGVSAPSHAGRRRPLLITAIFLCLAAVVGIIVGTVLEKDNMAGTSAFAFAIGLVTFAASFLPASRAHVRPRVRNVEQAMVVVTPMGLALVQDDLRGEVRWDEIKQVKFHLKAPGFAITSSGLTKGIDLAMAGTTVRLLDIYDRPLSEIHERIVASWK